MSTPPPDAPGKPGWKRALPVVGIVAPVVVGLVIANQAKPEKPAGRPAAAPAAVVERIPLRDADPVIGVTAGGRHRAYPLADLWNPDKHIVNDRFGDVPVTVAYCNLDDCVRAFTADAREGVLVLENGGAHPRKSRKMLVAVDGVRYELDTLKPLDEEEKRPFPYKPAEAVRTTWGEWRAKHPDTELRANGEVYKNDSR